MVVPLHGAPVAVLYPYAEVHPPRYERAVEVPLQGRFVLVLYPTADVHPVMNDEGVGVPLQAAPVVTLVPNVDEQPPGYVSAYAGCIATKEATTRNNPNVSEKNFLVIG
jgi:hypothetical protein